MRRYLKARSPRFDGLIGHRGHRVLKTGSWALIAKACAAVNLFLCVPFVLDSLGQRHFGAWAAIASLVTIGNFLDFGLGNGAMNLIASAKGRDALHEVVAIVRTAYASVLRITLLLSTSLCMLPFISWYRLLGLSANEAGISTASVAVVAVAILASIPLAIASKIQLGLGQGDKVFRWQALEQILTAASVIMFARLGAPLPTFVAGSTLLPLITLLFNTIQLHGALKKAGTTNIWVGTPEIDNGNVARIEADLIETLNPTANLQRPAPSSALQEATVSVIQQFEAEMHRHRPQVKSKAVYLQLATPSQSSSPA